MKAYRKLEPTPGLVLDDLPDPVCGPHDAVVRVVYAGICGTDRHIEEWDAWASGRVPLGTTIGHEFMGVVHEVGAMVTGLEPGDRVSAEGHIGCGRCQPCRTGNGHICEWVDILGVDIDGCFAELVRVPATNVWPVHDSIDDRTAALFDPFGNAVNTVATAGVGGRSVLVTGCGAIGLMAIAVARAMGAGTIIGVDVSEERLTLAREMGADHVLPAGDGGWIDASRSLTREQGPEVALEMSGSPSAVRGALDSVRNGGTVALLGLPAEPVSIDLPDQVIFKGLTIHGINGRRMFDTWYRAEELLVSGSVKIDRVISHELPFGRLDEAFELLREGTALKVLLNVSQAS